GRARVARIAADARALARHRDLEERLAVEVRPSGVGDQPMRRAVPRVDVRVDEARADEHAARVDLGVGAPVEAAAHVHDAIVLVHDDAVGHERVAARREADDPSAADERSHASFGYPASRAAWSRARNTSKSAGVTRSKRASSTSSRSGRASAARCALASTSMSLSRATARNVGEATSGGLGAGAVVSTTR